VSVGDGAVVAAQAVVAKDVRPYAIVVGNPAREIRRRFPDPVVESLTRIAWWDWDDDTVIDRVDDLCSPDVERFCRTYDPDVAGPAP
jgi:carbonic anhydrase/acetyltransferase-like protein (isoleucine patch superfamily)